MVCVLEAAMGYDWDVVQEGRKIAEDICRNPRFVICKGPMERRQDPSIEIRKQLLGNVRNVGL